MRRPATSVVDLVAERRLVQQEPDRTTLAAVLTNAERDIAAADANRSGFSPWTEVMLYEAGLRCSRIIVQAAGYRIDAGAGAHRTAIDAADALTGRARHTVFVRLHRMRRRRNEFMYETAADPTEQDLAQARRDVVLLHEVARKALEAIS
jgi:hypothetical protein